MKVIIRISMFVALYVATCACTKEVTFHRNDIEPQLMLNAQVVAGDTLHTVYMAISRNDRIGLVSISTPTTATVTFRRNYISHNVIN